MIWPIRWATASARRCELPGRSEAATWAQNWLRYHLVAPALPSGRSLSPWSTESTLRCPSWNRLENLGLPGRQRVTPSKPGSSGGRTSASRRSSLACCARGILRRIGGDLVADDAAEEALYNPNGPHAFGTTSGSHSSAEPGC